MLSQIEKTCSLIQGLKQEQLTSLQIIQPRAANFLDLEHLQERLGIPTFAIDHLFLEIYVLRIR